MSRADRTVDRFIRQRADRTVERAEKVAPISGRVEGANPDGTLSVVVNGQDCVSRGQVDSRAPGDGVTFGRPERVDGPAAAPGQARFGSPPGVMPQVTAVAPDVWPQGGTLDVVASGYFLDDVKDLKLFLGDPFPLNPFPYVTVDQYWPGREVEPTGDPEVDGPPDPAKMLMRIDVGSAPQGFAELGAVAVDNVAGRKDPEGAPLPPRAITQDLYQLGEPVPQVTAIDLLWSSAGIFQVTATGQNLSGIDTVEFTHPEPQGGFTFIEYANVISSTPTSLVIEIKKDDEFPREGGFMQEPDLSALAWVRDPEPMQFGTGGLQYTSGPVWQCYPSIVPIDEWVLFLEPFQNAGETIPPGLYATPQPFDPAQPGRVLLPGRGYAIPGGATAIASVYSPPSGAPFWFAGIISAQWIGGPEGRLVLAERGDAIADGHALPINYGVGSGVGWQVWDVLSGVLHPPVLFLAENRMMGPFCDGITVSAVTWQQGVGGQFVSAQFDGSLPVVGVRRSGSRAAGTAPHEAMHGTDESLTCTVWPATGFVPVNTQTWTATGRATGTYTYGPGLPDDQGVNWKTQNRSMCFSSGDFRVVEQGGSARSYISTGSSDADQWPSAGYAAGPDILDPDLFSGNFERGGVIGCVPAAGGQIWFSNVVFPGWWPAASAGSVARITAATQPYNLGAIMVYPPDILPDGAL